MTEQPQQREARAAGTPTTTADTLAPRRPATDAGQAPTERVRPTRPRLGRPGARARWTIASLVTVAVLVLSGAGFSLLSAGAATSALVGYVPSASLGYLEVRLDAPGDQRQNAANLLSHFPGFADQSSLPTKLNEALDQFVGNATGGRQTFTGNIRAWLGDSLAIAVPRLPARAAGAPREKAGLLLVSVKDPAAARAWADSTFGPGTATEAYGGVSLTSVEEHGATVEFGVVANVLLLGDQTSVHEAVDTGGAGTLAESASFKAAAAAVPGDRLAFGFLDLRGTADAVVAARPSAAVATAALDQLPAWIAVAIRAESDSLSATIALPQTNLAPVTSNHASVLATKLPSSTLAQGEIHGLAAVVAAITTTLRNQPETKGGQTQVDQALQSLGGIDGLVGWMGDASVAVVQTQGPTDLAVGIVVQAKDAAAAETRLLQLKNLASILGAAAGVTISDQSYNGVTITTIDAGDASVIPGGAVIGALTTSGRLQVAVAQKGDLVIAGLGDAFVKAVLDTKPGSSLADQADYRTAMDRAGASNTGQLYVDLRAVLDLASQRLPADALQHYQSDIKPYLDPFRAFAASGSAGDPNRARFVITVK